MSSQATTIRLGSLCELISAQVSPNQVRPDAHYLGLEHLASGRMRAIGHGKAADVQSHKFAFKRNDVLYSKLRPYLDKSVLADQDGICTTELLVLRAKPKVRPDFLACVVHAQVFIEHAMTGVTGAHHPRTSWPHVSSFEVPMLEEAQQAKFASILWDIHNLLIACKESEETLASLKNATMRELFTRGLRGETQRDSDIGGIPKSWSTRKINQIGSVKGGKRMPKGVSLVKQDTGRPYIRVTDFKDHSIRNEGILYVPNGYEDPIKRYRISSSDVYISIAGTIGLVGQVPKRFDDANLTENAARIVIEDSHVLPRYVMYALASDTCQEQIERATAKNAQPKLALTRIEQFRLPFPKTTEEQSEIVEILDAIDRKIDLHKRKRAVLEELFRTLLHKLMTGEIDVNTLDLSALPAINA